MNKEKTFLIFLNFKVDETTRTISDLTECGASDADECRVLGEGEREISFTS